MVSIRVGKAAIARSLAGVLLLAGAGLWQPAQAQYRGFGFPFFGNNPWFFGRPAPEPRAPRYRQPREREPANITAPPPPQKSEVTPAKTGIVIGDSMAEWLAYGLEQAYAESSDIGVVRKARPSTGLIDQCKGELRKWLEQSLANEKPAFVAIMIGMNDRRSLQPCAPSGKGDGTKAGPFGFRSKEWVEAYGKEIDEAISVLKSKGVPVFWVGLPPAKNVRAADVGFLNDVFREHAEKGGIGYIDVWDAFVDEDGDFTMRGPDVNGQTRLLRAADGLNFTKPGARKLALNLEREIGRTVLHPGPAEPPVAARGNNPPPMKPNERPVAGPVVPLAPPPGKGDALLGAANPERSSSDARLLGGEPAAPARGRADDFSWPRGQESPGFAQESSSRTQESSDVAPGSGKPRPRGASRKSGENAR
ncbi:MAG TPA: GDSL-type esterase/lipase family protein [Xanthobacteraceae bacterium]